MERDGWATEAIGRQRLAEAASARLDTPGDGALAARALATLARISAEARGLRADWLERFRAVGILAEPVAGPEDGDALQFLRTGVEIPRPALGEALALAGAAGFGPPFPVTPGRVAALAASAEAVDLVRWDGAATRLCLRLAGPPLSLPRWLRPGPEDVARLALPKALWPGYLALRPVRAAADRLVGRRPRASSDLLGTPESLIAPLVARMGLHPDDCLLDAGCGDGRILARAAALTGCRVLGVEANPELAAAARARLAEAGLTPPRAVVRTGLIGPSDLTHVTAIFLFLPRRLRAGLLPTLLAAGDRRLRILAHEQTPLGDGPAPDLSQAIIAEDALTVAHLWRADQG